MFVAVFMAAPVLAQTEPTPQTYRLAPGDRVSVVVFGQTEFSGDLLIDAAGNIRLPFVGPIEVANLTLPECQKRIVDRLAEGILNRPNVNVQISEFSPIFVLGDVRTAGVQPFKLGMTVKAAVAVAGGFGVIPPAQSTAVTELLASEERLRQLTLEKAILTIRKTRLEAQRDGAAFPAPDQANGRGDDSLADIVALEKETFDSQMAIQRSQIDLLHAQKPRIESEIEALNVQLVARKKQLDLVRQNADQYTRLTRQGLGLSSTEMQLRLTEATYESEMGNLSAQVARLKMDLGALDIRIQEADATFKRQILAELRDARDRLKNLDVTLPMAREIRDSRLQQTGNITDFNVPRSITVTRTRGGQHTVLAADETTLLEPGDIVEIQLRLARGRPIASVVTPQLGSGSLTSVRRDAALPEAPLR
ncbi:MAG: polysaccharide biosynthesis/export family protein [Xanthobacteraceae bacterium]|nr:polysaccharide biosynthesis/export family protein [Xanthobacteraceae bacterium]